MEDSKLSNKTILASFEDDCPNGDYNSYKMGLYNGIQVLLNANYPMGTKTREIPNCWDSYFFGYERGKEAFYEGFRKDALETT